MSEKMQESAFTLMRNRRAGILKSSPHPSATPRHNVALEDFIND